MSTVPLERMDVMKIRCFGLLLIGGVQACAGSAPQARMLEVDASEGVSESELEEIASEEPGFYEGTMCSGCDFVIAWDAEDVSLLSVGLIGTAETIDELREIDEQGGDPAAVVRAEQIPVARLFDDEEHQHEVFDPTLGHVTGYSISAERLVEYQDAGVQTIVMSFVGGERDDSNMGVAVYEFATWGETSISLSSNGVVSSTSEASR